MCPAAGGEEWGRCWQPRVEEGLVLTVALRFLCRVSRVVRPLTVPGPTSVTLAISSAAPRPSVRTLRPSTRTGRALFSRPSPALPLFRSSIPRAAPRLPPLHVSIAPPFVPFSPCVSAPPRRSPFPRSLPRVSFLAAPARPPAAHSSRNCCKAAAPWNSFLFSDTTGFV